jgi:hypothetical protein
MLWDILLQVAVIKAVSNWLHSECLSHKTCRRNMFCSSAYAHVCSSFDSLNPSWHAFINCIFMWAITWFGNIQWTVDKSFSFFCFWNSVTSVSDAIILKPHSRTDDGKSSCELQMRVWNAALVLDSVYHTRNVVKNFIGFTVEGEVIPVNEISRSRSVTGSTVATGRECKQRTVGLW